MGHNNRTLYVDGVNYRSGNGDSILRREKAPPPCGADYVCSKILDAQVDGFRAAVVSDYQKKAEDKARLAGVADELVGNTADTGLDAAEAADLMDAQGMGAATLTPKNRRHWEEATRLLQDPRVSAVDAALGACGVPSAALAAQRHAQAAGEGLLAQVINLPGGSTRRSTPGSSAHGGSVSSAAKLFAAHNASVSDAGLDAARRLSMTASAPSPVASRSGSAVCFAAGNAAARSAPSRSPGAAAVSSPFSWPEGARENFDRDLVPFELPSLSVMDAEQLAVAAHAGAFKDMAAHTPDLKADFVNGARANMLIGVMITCGVITPARFAEQLCSTRTTKPNTNILMMLATWISKLHRDTLASGEKRGNKRRRRAAAASTEGDGDVLDSGAGCELGSGTASSEEHVYDVDEPVSGGRGSGGALS